MTTEKLLSRIQDIEWINRYPKWITTLSTLTYGIYLVHILVMRNVLWKMDWMVGLNGCVQTIVCFV